MAWVDDGRGEEGEEREELEGGGTEFPLLRVRGWEGWKSLKWRRGGEGMTGAL